MAQTTSAPPKPTLPPFWKWLMRLTFTFTMVLFLAPTFYVVKYYAVDKPAEEAYMRQISVCACVPSPTMEGIVLWEGEARNSSGDKQLAAIKTLGRILQTPGVSFSRPLECLSAKATLSEVATKASDPAARATASAELGKVAQGGAVIRR